MKTELSTIIMDGMDVVECIRREALTQNTVKCPLEDITQIEWQNTTELYILGDNTAHLADGGLEAGCYMDSDTASQVIVIGASNERITRIINRCGGNLHRLDLRFLDMESLELPSRFARLEQLRLSPMGHLREIKGLESLGSLKELDLSFTKLGTVFDVTGFPLLRRLDLAGNTELMRVEGLSRLSSLEELDLSGTAVGAELDLSNLHNLKRIRLVDTDKLEKAYGFGESPNLAYVDLSCSGITRIPDDIQNLKKLMHLDLSNLSLDDLPDWLPELGLEFTYCEGGINLRGTKVLGADMALFSEKTTAQNFAVHQELIKKWFIAQKEESAKPLNEMKVVFLGDGEAGKSHTIARLLNDGGDPVDYVGQSTPGVVIRNKEYDMEGRRFTVHYWDFGGQEIMHSMHRLFLTGRTLYVVILNARDDTQGDRAKYWLHSIKSFAPNAPVLLVLNKIDQNPLAAVDERDLRRRFPKLAQVVRLSALHFSREEFNRSFIDVLLEEISNTGYLDIQWPISWIKIKDKLESLQSHYITGDVYQELCQSMGMEQNQRDLLHWFNDLGISFCFCDDEDYGLSDYIVLRPDWITNALYIILFNRLEGVQNGLIPHRFIHNILRNAHNNPDIRCTLPQAKYNSNDIQYVLGIMRKFNLSFPHGTEHEFIPMLCQQNSTVDVQFYYRDQDVLEFNMEFDYLPNNLLHQLMVERHDELDLENVWRTGARFWVKELGYSAVVVIDGNTLRFFILHTNTMHRPNTYLTMLKAHVNRIVEKIGLAAPACKLVYKMAGKRDEFDYEEIAQFEEWGDTSVFSKAHRRRLPIEDVLNQSAPASVVDETQLLDAIRRSCLRIQAAPDYYLRPGENNRGMEDKRNRRIRDDLEMMGYDVKDQTPRGVSGSGKGIGELDILVYNEEHRPWAAIEALRISDCSKANWNKHLDKLIGTYNFFGTRFLYLLTYIDTDPSVFSGIWNGYQKHIQKYNPDQYTYCNGSFVALNDSDSPQYIKTAKCQYSCGGDQITVYHIFARIPTQNE